MFKLTKNILSLSYSIFNIFGLVICDWKFFSLWRAAKIKSENNAVNQELWKGVEILGENNVSIEDLK